MILMLPALIAPLCERLNMCVCAQLTVVQTGCFPTSSMLQWC